MPKPLLLLHHRADVNTNDIWRAAIQAGWSTERVDMSGRVDIPPDCPMVRYYGNTLHMKMIERQLPIVCLPLDLTVLAKTPLTKRRISLMRAEELGEITERTFIKPAQNKWFPAKVYEAGDSPKRSQGGAGLPSDWIYVSDPVDMINEIRCFCLNGKIHTASYYRIGHEYCPIGIDEVDRPEILDQMVAELAPYYPPGVVLDFAYMRISGSHDYQWGLCEPNEVWSCGLYSADPLKVLDCIVASQEAKT